MLTIIPIRALFLHSYQILFCLKKKKIIWLYTTLYTKNEFIWPKNIAKSLSCIPPYGEGGLKEENHVRPMENVKSEL